jgi:hypothetical protein
VIKKKDGEVLEEVVLKSQAGNTLAKNRKAWDETGME